TLNDSSAEYGTLAALASANCFATTANCYQTSVDDPALRPAPHWDASFREQPSAVAPVVLGPFQKTWTLHIGKSFTDVPTSHPFYAFIENIFHNGITSGCGTGYCPENSVTRAQMAVFLLKGKHGQGFVPPACSPPGIFADVTCPATAQA